MSQQFYGLLVGINRYAATTINNLSGCVNDVTALEQWLDHLDIPQKNVTKLLDEQATHQAIKDTFRQQLIEPVRAWAEAGKHGDAPAILFHFCGHGSYTRDSAGKAIDETIVCHDSRLDHIYDIRDWELGEMLEEILQFTDNVTVILDSCHSGSGVNFRGTEDIAVRSCEPDTRPQPTQRPASMQKRTRAATSSGWFDMIEKYVLLAACRHDEKACECKVGEGYEARIHGAFTYYLLKTLSAMSANRPLTYREIREKVQYEFKCFNLSQTPQCEGARERSFLGNVRIQQDEFLTVIEQRDGLFWVNAGAIYGLTIGSKLHVYSPQTRRVSEVGTPIATLVVEHVGAVQSGCLVLEGETDVPFNARATIAYRNPTALMRYVALHISDSTLAGALQARLMQPKMQNHLGITSDGAYADFLIQLIDNHLEIQNSAGNSLVAPYPLQLLENGRYDLNMPEFDELEQDLLHLIRYRNVLELTNPNVDEELEGGVTFEIKRLIIDPQTKIPQIEPFELAKGGELVIHSEQPFMIEIANHTHKPLYMALFEFGYDWDIAMHYPTRGENKATMPDQPIYLGIEDGPYKFRLPDGKNEVRETFKLIATTDDADFAILEQGELKKPYNEHRFRGRSLSPLEQVMQQAMEGKRALLQKKIDIPNDWLTTQVSLVVRK